VSLVDRPTDRRVHLPITLREAQHTVVLGLRMIRRDERLGGGAPGDRPGRGRIVNTNEDAEGAGAGKDQVRTGLLVAVMTEAPDLRMLWSIADQIDVAIRLVMVRLGEQPEAAGTVPRAREEDGHGLRERVAVLVEVEIERCERADRHEPMQAHVGPGTQ